MNGRNQESHLCSQENYRIQNPRRNITREFGAAAWMQPAGCSLWRVNRFRCFCELNVQVCNSAHDRELSVARYYYLVLLILDDRSLHVRIHRSRELSQNRRQWALDSGEADNSAEEETNTSFNDEQVLIWIDTP